MKLASAAILACLVSSVAAFAPRISNKAFLGKTTSPVARFLAEEPSPFFAATEKGEGSGNEDDMSFEDEVEAMVQKELAKTRKASRLKTADGQQYAPWMNISDEDEERIRNIMKEKAEARRKRKEQEQRVTGSLYLDSAFQELSGTGLTAKVIDETSIELEWATMSEKDTQGFIVKRRPAKTEDFSIVASFQDWGPLKSKGPEGGVYRYLDTTAAPGGWVYRVSECDNNGNENDICQCLAEVETAEEARNTLIAAVGFGVLAIGAIAAGLLLDPMDGY